MQDKHPETEDKAANADVTQAEAAAVSKDGADDGIEAQLQQANETIANLKDQMLRERAEIENQRRRLQRDMDQARRFANERLLQDLLAVCDNLEHGLASDTDNAGALREGMELTHKSLLKVVTEHGLEVLNPVGDAFDPELHQAMSTVPTNEQAPDTVVSVMQKGYVLNDRLLRPALVMVAKAP